MVFTTGHEAFTYQKLDIRSCVYTKRYTNHKPTCKVQTQRQHNNTIVIVSRWDNKVCIIHCYYVCFGLLM